MYVRSEPSARTVDTVNFIHVQQGHEPISFKRLFRGWKNDMWVVSLCDVNHDVSLDDFQS